MPRNSILPALWGVNALVALVVLLWVAATPLTLDWRSLVAPTATSCGLTVLAFFYRRRDGRIALTLVTFAQLTAFTIVAELLSYALASAGGPLWDARLYAADRSLGLDWRAYLGFVDARPWLGTAFHLAYLSLFPQIVLTVLGLGLAGKARALQAFAAALMLSCLVCLIVSALMPAFANFVYLGLTPADFPNLRPAASFVHVAALEGLRSGAITALSLRDSQGIITFPSFHAALAVIFALSVRRVRGVRWLSLGLNALVVLATPIDGGHYFVDVLAGVAIALAAFWAASRFAAHEKAPHLAMRGRFPAGA